MSGNVTLCQIHIYTEHTNFKYLHLVNEKKFSIPLTTFSYPLIVNDTKDHINLTDSAHKMIVILNTCRFFVDHFIR